MTNVLNLHTQQAKKYILHFKFSNFLNYEKGGVDCFLPAKAMPRYDKTYLTSIPSRPRSTLQYCTSITSRPRST
jgi:hypothetical protein